MGEYMCSCMCVRLFTHGLCSHPECLIPVSVGVFILVQSGEVSAGTAAGYP